MKIQNFHINTAAIYQPGVTTGDTITMQLEHVTGAHLITFEPVILSYAPTFFTIQIECVIDPSQEDLTEGKIWLIDGDGYYGYAIKKNNVTIESGQLFIQAPQQTTIENNPNNSVIITQFGAGSSGSSGQNGTNGLSGTSGESGTSGLTGTSGVNGQNGTSGINGTSGVNGTSGQTGASGSSGSSGQTGLTGTSGISGTSGQNGTSGLNGSSGSSGQSGSSGSSASSGSSGQSGISAGAIYYFNQSQTTTGGKKLLDPTPSGAAQQQVGVTIPATTNQILISDFLTDELGFAVIPGGTQRFHLHFLKPASNDNLKAWVKIELCDQNGAPYGTTIDSGVEAIGWNGTNPVEVTCDITLTTTTINPTDRMNVKIYVNNLDNQNHDVIWYTEGTAYYSFVITTVGSLGASSGTSGANGSSGSSGANGQSGTSGINGTGVAGSSGSSGATGAAGVNGTSGTSSAGGTDITYITKKTVSYLAGGDGPNSVWRHAPLVGITTTTITIPANTLRLAVFQLNPQAIITDVSFIVSGTAGTSVNIGIYKMGIIGTGSTAYLAPTDLVYTIATGLAINTAGQKTISGLSIDMSAYSTQENIYCIGIQAVSTTATITHFTSGQTLAPGWGSYITGGTVYRLGAYVTAVGAASLPSTISTTITGATEAPFIIWKQY